MAIALVLVAGGFVFVRELLGGCVGQEEHAESIAHMDVLQRRPEGAHPAPGSEKVEYGCVDEGGGWVYAEQRYAFEGRNRQVVDFYRGVARERGLPLDEEGKSAPDTLGGLCFSEEVDGRPVLVRVRFDLFERGRPGGYIISAEAALNGEPIRCWL
ncbi:hypothetical protein [Streptomyces sudanensis]|uniref:hypothetical protein n=1 Tax=Streptomyces sudanensis TaxID=436397 RepID=UPI0020CC0A79|nr:hypothetical protein [Streptomyces sudanensis]MCP9956866.1 hypothetical protein [Streptomyces sudanensis]MCQ0002554.1 hypothetical protein [Streptomyces sudanensis]